MYRLPAGRRADLGYYAVDLDGQPKADLLIADFEVTLQREVSGTYNAASEAVTLYETSVAGAYEFRFTPENAGKYALTITPLWAGAASGTLVYQFSFASAAAAAIDTYASLGQVKAYLGHYETDDGADDDLLEQLLTEATARVDALTNQTWWAESVTEYYDGLDSAMLTLRRYPVSAVTSIHVSTDLPRVYDSTTLLTADEEYLVDTQAGIVERPSGVWPKGANAVKVVYTAGEDAPTEISRATMLLAAYWFRTRRGGAFESVSMPDGSVTGIASGAWFAEAQDICARHRRIPV